MPTARLTTKTSTVRFRTCSLVGQETFFSSDHASSRKRRMRSTALALLAEGGRGDRTRTYNRWFWRPVLCQLSYTPTDRDRQRLVVTWPPGGGCGAARVDNTC